MECHQPHGRICSDIFRVSGFFFQGLLGWHTQGRIPGKYSKAATNLPCCKLSNFYVTKEANSNVCCPLPLSYCHERIHHANKSKEHTL